MRRARLPPPRAPFAASSPSTQRGADAALRASALLPSHTARPPHPQTARRACVRTYELQSRPSPPFPGVRKGQGSLGLDHRTQQDCGACPTEAFYPARPVARRRIS